MTRQEFERLLRDCGPQADIDDDRVYRVIDSVMTRIMLSGGQPLLSYVSAAGPSSPRTPRSS